VASGVPRKPDDGGFPPIQAEADRFAGKPSGASRQLPFAKGSLPRSVSIYTFVNIAVRRSDLRIRHNPVILSGAQRSRKIFLLQLSESGKRSFDSLRSLRMTYGAVYTPGKPGKAS
jgi:hypothetical protein